MKSDLKATAVLFLVLYVALATALFIGDRDSRGVFGLICAIAINTVGCAAWCFYFFSKALEEKEILSRGYLREGTVKKGGVNDAPPPDSRPLTPPMGQGSNQK